MKEATYSDFIFLEILLERRARIKRMGRRILKMTKTAKTRRPLPRPLPVRPSTLPSSRRRSSSSLNSISPSTSSHQKPAPKKDWKTAPTCYFISLGLIQLRGTYLITYLCELIFQHVRLLKDVDEKTAFQRIYRRVNVYPISLDLCILS